MKIPKITILAFTVIIITLGLSISLQSLLAGWSPPAANPPNQNVSAPINESTQTQSKDGTLVFHNTLNNPNSLLIATGTLSIGTLFPNNSYLLDVNGSINAKKVCIAGNCKANWIDVSPWTIIGTGIYYSGGNVGIGTNDPQYKLQVGGHLKSSGTVEGQSLSILEQTTGAYGMNPENMLTQLMASPTLPLLTKDFWKIYGEGPADAGQLVIETGDDKAEPIVFRQRQTWAPVSYRDSMVIDMNGNVGIGNITPAQKLDVNGNIYASGDVCNGSGKCLSTAGGAGGADSGTLCGTSFFVTDGYGNFTGNLQHWYQCKGQNVLTSSLTSNCPVDYDLTLTSYSWGISSGVYYRYITYACAKKFSSGGGGEEGSLSCITVNKAGTYPTATCPVGYTVTGGGGSCDNGSTYIQQSSPVGNGWQTGCAAGGYQYPGSVYAVCCN